MSDRRMTYDRTAEKRCQLYIFMHAWGMCVCVGGGGGWEGGACAACRRFAVLCTAGATAPLFFGYPGFTQCVALQRSSSQGAQLTLLLGETSL